MTWRPSTDFEEEIVNLQPHNDFIFGSLNENEPQTFYPRPQAHIDYAETRKKQAKKQQEEYEATGKFNSRLQLITEVQRIAGTKPLGELTSVNDWDSDKDVETEVVAMMRHFGLGPSVEEPLNERVTLATYPFNNGVEIMKNGPKTVPLLFNNNLFKLKPKVSSASSSSSSSSSASSSYSSSPAPRINNNNLENSDEESFETLSSNSSKNLKSFNERQELLLKAQRFGQYEKLHEESEEDGDKIFSSISSNQYSFKTAQNGNISSNSFESNGMESLNTSYEYDSINNSLNSNNTSFNTSGMESNSSSNATKRSSGISSTSFLQRFIKSDDIKKSTPAPPPPSFTYANVTKNLVKPPEPSAPNSIKLSSIPPTIRFYTPRELYEKKRRPKGNLS